LIKNRFQELLAILEREHGRKYSQREIAAITGVAQSTISAIASNQVQRYDVDTVSRLVKFLGVDVTEFFVMVPDEPDDGGNIEVSEELAGAVA
jgi:transcriptional regulator with XRE-family HTH domain